MDRNEQPLELLKVGVGAFNEWRRSSPTVPIDLTGVSLEGIDLTDANLSGVDLRGASLLRVDANGANLSGALLVGADCREIGLVNADLGGAVLHEANFSGAFIMGADLSDASACGATFAGADLDRADLTAADFSDASLVGCRLRGATVAEAVFTGADLSRVSFEGVDMQAFASLGQKLAEADFRKAAGLRLDGEDIRAARFAPRATDAWSVVRRSYTGPLLLFNLVLLAGFLAPYLFRAAKWHLVAELQDRELAALADSSIDWPLWKLLLGWDRGSSFAATGAFLIAYNLLRAALTWWLSQVRDAEERSGFAPEWNSYAWCYYTHHYFMRHAVWLSLICFLWHAVPWVMGTVSVPRSP